MTPPRKRPGSRPAPKMFFEEKKQAGCLEEMHPDRRMDFTKFIDCGCKDLKIAFSSVEARRMRFLYNKTGTDSVLSYTEYRFFAPRVHFSQKNRKIFSRRLDRPTSRADWTGICIVILGYSNRTAACTGMHTVILLSTTSMCPDDASGHIKSISHWSREFSYLFVRFSHKHFHVMSKLIR